MANNLSDPLVAFYDDGPDFPTNAERQEAERAYRDAFLKSTNEASGWKSIDHEAIQRAWRHRRRVRQQAEVLVPSSVVFGDANLKSDQVRYKQDHLIAASRTRGRVHGFEFVRQCWEELAEAGVEESRIAPEIIKPWLKSVAKWVATEIKPDRLDTPRLPDLDLAERQKRMLNEAKAVIAMSDPTKPESILHELNQITRETLEWLWPGRIPLGKLTLLAGDPGLGKSFVTLDLAARVSRGDAWPDSPLLKQKPAHVILMNCEDDAGDTIAPRLDAAGADDSRIVLHEGITHLGHRRQFSLEMDLPRLEEAVDKYPETRLIVIDPISAYCGKVDSHKNSDVRGMLAPLAEFASRRKLSVLAITHLAKSGGAKAVYRAMGSLAFAAAARAVWAITKDSDDSERRLFLPAKLNLAKDPDGLAYRIVDGRVEWEQLPVTMHADDAFANELSDKQPKRRGREREEAAEWLCEYLGDGEKPASDVLEMGKQYGFSERTLRRAYKQIGTKPRKESFEGPWLWSLIGESFMLDSQDDKVPP